jgi:RHS repeat-associated protein
LAEINPTDEDVPASSFAGTAQPDPFTGTMVFRLPIQVPPGRRGVQPNIELVYRSSNGNDWAGVGWKLELGQIERKRWVGQNGELLINYASDEYLFRLNGETQELVKVPGGDGTEYRAKIESGFMRFRKLPNSGDLNRPYWEVTDRLGVKYFFGQTPASRLVEPVDQTDKIFEWLLDRVQDPPGNYLTATYDRSLPGLIYLRDIQYTGNNPTYTGPTDTGSIRKSPTNIVSFVLDAVSNPVHTKFPNYNVVAGKRLKAIAVKANTNTLVRAYKLAYAVEPYRGNGESTRSLLQSLQEVGKPTSVDAVGAVTGGLAAQPWTFNYADIAPGLENGLASISNGLGGAIAVSYAEDFAGPNNLYHFARVSALSVSDGTGTPPSVTTYEYSQPFYYVPQREFRGYQSAKITEAPGAQGEQRVTETWFHQGNDVAVDVNIPNVPDGYLRGKPYRIQVRDGQGRMFSETTIGYQFDADGTAPFFTPQLDVRTTTCDGTACTKQTRSTYAYDAYGNVVQKDQYGDFSNGNAVTADDRTVVRVFTPNVSAWIVGLPAKEIVYAGVPATAQVAATFWCYDWTSSCLGSTVQSPVMGNVTHRVRWLSGDSGDVTKMTYDTYGNVATRLEPWNGIRYTGFIYDPTATFVIQKQLPQLEISAVVRRFKVDLAYYGVNGVPMDLGLYGESKSVSDMYETSAFGGAPAFYPIRREYDNLGRLSRAIQPDGATVTVSYEAWGTVGMQHVRRQHSEGLITRVYFDGLGRSIRRENPGPDGKTVVTQTQYDARGAVRAQSLPAFSGDGTLWQTMSYDPMGRITQVLNPDGSRTLQCQDDWVTASVDANGHWQREVRDVAGRVLTIEEFGGTVSSCSTTGAGAVATMQFQYDTMGNLRYFTDAKGNQTERRYDALNRMVYLRDPDLGTHTYTYYMGLLNLETDGAGKVVQHIHDTWARPVKKTYGPPISPIIGVVAAYYYDADPPASYGHGHLSGMDGQPGQVDYTYDPAGHVIREGRKFNGNVKTNIAMSYDGLGRLTSITYPDNSVVQYEYNGPWLKRIYEGAFTYVSFSNFTAQGQPQFIQHGNGVSTTLAYHPQNRRLLSRSTAKDGTTLQNFTYAYDLVGNITSVSDPQDGNQTFGYDEQDRLTTASGPFGTFTFIYDSIGNLLFNPLVGSYTYPSSGLGSVRPHAVSTAGPNTYSYDLNGNLKAVTGNVSRSFSYDQEQRLTGVTTNGVATTVTYDAVGMRATKTVGTTTIEYRSPYYECEKTGNVATCVKYIWAGSWRVAMKQVGNGPIAYFHPDHLGSTSVVTNAQGTVDQRLTYYPFGATRTSTGPANVPYKYTGQELDASSGLYNYKARIYDATLARFIQPDTMIAHSMNPQSYNRYSYVMNNPLRLIDPTGHMDEISNSEDWSFRDGSFTPDKSPIVGNVYNRDGQTTRWSLDSTTNSVVTYYNVINGMVNSLDEAKTRGISQVTGYDKSARTFTLWYNPSEGMFLDLLESARDKFGWTTPIAKETANLLKSNPNSLWFVHSQGSLIFASAVSYLNSQDISLSNGSVIFNGAAANQLVTGSIMAKAGVTISGWNGHPADFVHDVVGINSLNPFRWVIATILLPTLWFPEVSQHCCYP